MFFFFFFNDTATTEIYTLSLHDALPICRESFANAIAVRSEVDGSPALPMSLHAGHGLCASRLARDWYHIGRDRKSTRLNSSHANISYAVFCLKKKKHHRSYHCYGALNQH